MPNEKERSNKAEGTCYECEGYGRIASGKSGYWRDIDCPSCSASPKKGKEECYPHESGVVSCCDRHINPVAYEIENMVKDKARLTIHPMFISHPEAKAGEWEPWIRMMMCDAGPSDKDEVIEKVRSLIAEAREEGDKDGFRRGVGNKDLVIKTAAEIEHRGFTRGRLSGIKEMASRGREAIEKLSKHDESKYKDQQRVEAYQFNYGVEYARTALDQALKDLSQ